MSEPWLSGPIEGVHPLVAPLLYSLQQAREDLRKYTEGLTADQLWAKPGGSGSVGFHIRHAGGAAERLTTYLEGGELSEAQMTALKVEADAGATLEALFAELEARFARTEAVVRNLNPAALTEPRGVGRKKLPTTVIGLIVHIAEHTQRHVGQAVTTARIVRALP